MKILVCTSEYYPYGSGIANVVYNVVNQFKKMEVNCTVCSPTGPDIKVGSSKMIQEFGILGLLNYWFQVFRYFKENNFDVMWFHNPLFLRSNHFRKSLITIHTTYYSFMTQGIKPEIYYKIASKIEKYCLNKIDRKIRFTAVGLNVCEELEEIGIDRQRITYIPNGVDIERFKPSKNKKTLRKKFRIPEDDLIILSLGRLTDPKQPQKLIEAFSMIERNIKNVTLVIAGRGELLTKTKKFAKEKKLKNVKFLGYVNHEKDTPDLYACSDYYIMTSKYEGQPLTLLEAMSSGLPCIVSDIPSLRIVKDVNCGLIVDFNDMEKTVERIIEYLGRDNSDHSRNAREYALKNLDWKIIAKRYLEEFEKVIIETEEKQRLYLV